MLWGRSDAEPHIKLALLVLKDIASEPKKSTYRKQDLTVRALASTVIGLDANEMANPDREAIRKEAQEEEHRIWDHNGVGKDPMFFRGQYLAVVDALNLANKVLDARKPLDEQAIEAIAYLAMTHRPSEPGEEIELGAFNREIRERKSGAEISFP